MAQNSNIRRIDELGRIVIPKDIRKKLHIKDSEPLEIYIEDNEIRIKKYSSLPDIIEYIKYLIDIGNRITSNKYIITNRENIIAASIKELSGIKLPKEIEDMVLKSNLEKNTKVDFKIASEEIKAHANIAPIILDNDRSGLIVEYNENKELTNDEVVKLFKNLIENQLNNY